jgi:hypothetical protein
MLAAIGTRFSTTSTSPTTGDRLRQIGSVTGQQCLRCHTRHSAALASTELRAAMSCPARPKLVQLYGGAVERDWLGDRPMTVSVLGGRLTFQQDLGLPFAKDVVAALEEFGLANQDTATVESAYRDLPKFEPDLPPTAALGLDDLVVGLGIYLAGALTDATIGAVVDELYQRRIQPALARLWSRIRSSKHRPETTRVLLDHWFDGSGVLVRIEFSSSPGGSVPTSETVRSCLKQAAEWISRNPRTHRVLTFTADHGAIQADPRLSEPIT